MLQTFNHLFLRYHASFHRWTNRHTVGSTKNGQRLSRGTLKACRLSYWPTDSLISPS